MYLLWFYFITACAFSCLAKLAKAYPVSRPTYMSQISNQLHCIQSNAQPMVTSIYFARLLSFFIFKPCAFAYKSLKHLSIFVCSSSLLRTL